MTRMQGVRFSLTMGFLVFFWIGWWAAVAGADISVSLQPDTLCVTPLQQFNVYLWIDQAGSGFNGYAAVVRFDPTKLTFVSVQEDTLLTGICGFTWWAPEVGPDSVFFSHSAMCGPDSVTGPGALSSITFRARSAAAVTEVSFDYIELYYGGYVIPSTSHDAVVIVTSTCPATGSCCFWDGSCQVAVPEDCEAQGGVFLHFLEDCDANPCESMSSGEETGEIEFEILPNPSTKDFELRYSLPEACDVRVEICDAQGRLVRRLLSGREGPGSGSIPWGACDQNGRPVARGAYFARLAMDGRVQVRRLILID